MREIGFRLPEAAESLSCDICRFGLGMGMGSLGGNSKSGMDVFVTLSGSGWAGKVKCVGKGSVWGFDVGGKLMAGVLLWVLGPDVRRLGRKAM